jgi:hypothetical protein
MTDPSADNAADLPEGWEHVEMPHEPGIFAAPNGLSVQDAATVLQVTPKTIRRRLKQGTLKGWQQPTSQGYEWRVQMDMLGREMDSPPHVQVPTPSEPTPELETTNIPASDVQVPTHDKTLGRQLDTQNGEVPSQENGEVDTHSSTTDVQVPTQSNTELIRALDLIAQLQESHQRELDLVREDRQQTIEQLRQENDRLYEAARSWQSRATQAEAEVKLLMAPRDDLTDVTPSERTPPGDNDPDWQGIAQALEERVKRLEETPAGPHPVKPWWRRLFG